MAKTFASPVFLLCLVLVSGCTAAAAKEVADDGRPTKQTNGAAVNVNAVCPLGFTYVASVDGCYRVVSEYLNWADASLRCQSFSTGAHLVFISSDEEQMALNNLLNNYETGSTGWWIGSQRAIPGQRTDFYWKGPYATCSNCGVSVPLGSYGYWYSGEPSFGNNEESCLMLFSRTLSYKWNDYTCGNVLRFVCEIDMKQTCF